MEGIINNTYKYENEALRQRCADVLARLEDLQIDSSNFTYKQNIKLQKSINLLNLCEKE